MEILAKIKSISKFLGKTIIDSLIEPIENFRSLIEEEESFGDAEVSLLNSDFNTCLKNQNDTCWHEWDDTFLSDGELRRQCLMVIVVVVVLLFTFCLFMTRKRRAQNFDNDSFLNTDLPNVDVKNLDDVFTHAFTMLENLHFQIHRINNELF